MNPKKIILCPNPSRDRGMKTTQAAEHILRDMGFQTVVCSPFRDQKEELFAGYQTKPLPQELKTADLLLTLGGDGCTVPLNFVQQGFSGALTRDLATEGQDLERARELHPDPRITYRQAAMEDVDFPAGSLDIVFSSLAFHYVRDFVPLVQNIARWLRPGG